MTFVSERYNVALRWAIRRRMITAGVVPAFWWPSRITWLSAASLVPNSCPTDEGALWVRGTLAQAHGQMRASACESGANRTLFLPEVPAMHKSGGRPDDGTDNTGFFNTEYFVDLKPKEQWRPVFHENKEELIAACSANWTRSRRSFGVSPSPLKTIWRGRQWREGRARHQDLWRRFKVLDKRAMRSSILCAAYPALRISEFFAARPADLNVTVDREAPAGATRSMLPMCRMRCRPRSGEPRLRSSQGRGALRLTLRYLPKYRNTQEAIANIRLLSPSGERVSLAQLCKISETDGASEVYRRRQSPLRCHQVQCAGRDLGSTVEEAIKKVNEQVKLPPDTARLGGEYESQKRANAAPAHRASHHNSSDLR